MKQDTEKEKLYKEIVDARDPMAYSAFKSPEVGSYVITGMQCGNLYGQLSWMAYIGYVVQVRIKAGAFGSDMVFLRHPNGELRSHENQCFYSVSKELKEKMKAVFDKGVTPEEMEDYTQPYTLAGKYPKVGRVIEAGGEMPPVDNSPLCQITVCKSDGSREITVC